MEDNLLKNNIENHNKINEHDDSYIVDLFDENELFEVLEQQANIELAIYVQTNLSRVSQLMNVVNQDNHYSKHLLKALQEIRKD